MTVDVDLDKHERGLDSRLISETGGFQLNIWEIRMGMNCWIKVSSMCEYVCNKWMLPL